MVTLCVTRRNSANASYASCRQRVRHVASVPYSKRRCPVPADGYYECKRLHPGPNNPSLFAWWTTRRLGLRACRTHRKTRAASGLLSFSMVTTEAKRIDVESSQSDAGHSPSA